MPKITISEAGKSPRIEKFEAKQKTITIGRGSDNDITINCESVSTRHCHIEKTEDGYILQDDDSTNGIKHKGTRQPSVELSDGTEVLVGDIPLTFHDSKVAQGSKEEPETIPAAGANTCQKKWLKPILVLGVLAMAGIAIMPWLGEGGMGRRWV